MQKVAFIFNVNRGNSEREIEFDLPVTIDNIYRIIGKHYECKKIEAVKDVSVWTKELIIYCPDVIFCVGEGYRGSAREAIFPAIFEQLDIKYCGPDPTNLLVMLNKVLTKRTLGILKGLTIPKSAIYDGKNLCGDKISAPYILKLNDEGSSIGTKMVEKENDLREELSKLFSQYQTNILVEEYVKGRDVSMIYVEGLGVFGPAMVEYKIGSFYDHSLKSCNDSEVFIKPAQDLPQPVVDKLRVLTENVVYKLDAKGYVKIDYRIDGDRINFIEVNGQVSFHSEGEFAVCCLADGKTLEEIILHIIKYSLNVNRMSSLGFGY